MKDVIVWIILIVMSGSYIMGLQLFQKSWQGFGLVSDEKRIEGVHSYLKKEKPMLDASNQKVRQGQSVMIESLAKARDYDGNNISENIEYLVSGSKHKGKLDTSKPGAISVLIRVMSPKTGLSNEKKILVLVDGGN